MGAGLGGLLLSTLAYPCRNYSGAVDVAGKLTREEPPEVVYRRTAPRSFVIFSTPLLPLSSVWIYCRHKMREMEGKGAVSSG